MSSLATTAAEIYDEAFRAGLKPDPLLTVSQWADRYRTLSQRASAEPGPWRTDRTPYLREIMDCLSPSSPVERVVFMKGAQIGGTECGNNWIGYVIHQAPGPMMAVQPTVEMAKRNSKQRIDPLIEESHALRELVKDPRSRDSGNTILAKEFPGGVLVMTGANSAVGLRSMAARYLFLDEVDAYPGDVEGEGDPINLALARTRTFARRKVFLVLDAEDHRHEPDRSGVRGQRSAPLLGSVSALLRVPDAEVRATPVAEGTSRRRRSTSASTAARRSRTTRSTGCCRAASGGRRRQGRERRRDFICPVSTAPSAGSVGPTPPRCSRRRRRTRPCFRSSSTPCSARRGRCGAMRRIGSACTIAARTTRSAWFREAGCSSRLASTFRRTASRSKWWPGAAGRESWSVDYQVLEGRTAEPAVWQKLTALLETHYPTESGASLPITKFAIDSGYATPEVYAWARQHGGARAVVIKGDARAAAPVGQPSPD